MHEALPRTGPVQAGRLVEVGGHLLQGRQQDHHLEADALPDRQDDDRGQRRELGAQPVLGPEGTAREEPEQGVEEAVVPAGEDQPPDEGHQGDGEDDGEEEDGPEDPDPPDGLLHEQGQREREGGLHRDHHGREDQVVEQRAEEPAGHVGVGEDPGVLGQPHEGGIARVAEPDVVEGEADGRDERDRDEQDEQQHGGTRHEDPGEPVPPEPPAGRWSL